MNPKLLINVDKNSILSLKSCTVALPDFNHRRRYLFNLVICNLCSAGLQLGVPEVWHFSSFEVSLVDPLHWRCRFSMYLSNLSHCNAYHGTMKFESFPAFLLPVFQFHILLENCQLKSIYKREQNSAISSMAANLIVARLYTWTR